MRLSNGFVIDKEKTFGELKFTAVRDVFLQNEDGTPSTQLKKRIYDLKCSLHGGIIPVSVPPEVPLKDYQQGLKRRKDKEIPFCELPEIFVENFAVWDDYETDYTIFSVCGIDIRVLDDGLAEALKKLPERKRNTLLMYYFLEMTESEIANLQKITQSGVFKNRHHALETMKKILKEKQ